uniref:CCR4-NOT transcription complex subunit 6-like n=1 Tax=Hucho hucho TaxID=62062 RepID=A0A4W5KWW2_9TELE
MRLRGRDGWLNSRSLFSQFYPQIYLNFLFFNCFSYHLFSRELLLNNNLLRVLPYELGRLFQLQTLGLKGNPLSQDILNLYQESDGTRKLLNYMLDNLAGKMLNDYMPQSSR